MQKPILYYFCWYNSVSFYTEIAPAIKSKQVKTIVEYAEKTVHKISWSVIFIQMQIKSI